MSELEAHTIPREISNGEDVHAMKSEQDVRLMLHLKSQGSSTYEIARLLNCSRTTVRRYLRLGGWQPAKSRGSKLSGLERWLEECFERHAGNAEVIHQHLRQEWDLAVSLRTVQRAVRPLRRRLRASRVATVRFETAPGKQMQVDFGTRRVLIGGVLQQVHVLVATLGYSRRQFVAAYEHEMQAAWLDGMERAFQHFGGVPRTVLMDNPKALVSEPRRGDRAPVFQDRVLAFAAYWHFQPRACVPYRARTKGKVERSVGYVKNNALAGRTFAGWGELDRHLQSWLQNVADLRILKEFDESPATRFERERPTLTPRSLSEFTCIG